MAIILAVKMITLVIIFIYSIKSYVEVVRLYNFTKSPTISFFLDTLDGGIIARNYYNSIE